MVSNSQIGIIRVIAIAAAFTFTAGCAHTAHDIGSPADLAAVNDAGKTPVAFGRLALERNGEAVSFGKGLGGNSASLNMYEVGQSRHFAGEVGADGVFSWALPPGTYRVDSIAFRYQDQTVQPETNFTFTVSPNHDASYLGTIKLEASYDAGYMGVSGGVEKFTVWNDCATECQKQVDKLGLSSLESSTSLLQWNQEAATVARADVVTR